MSKFCIVLSFVLVAGLLAAAGTFVPRGVESGKLLAAADDPARLSDLALDKAFNADVATREIEAALVAEDIELAQSFVALARDRNVALDPALVAKVEAGATASAETARGIGHFARGLVTGEPDDLASLAGTATGDLFVFGDARDALREGVRLARGEEADQLILGLACVGLVVTAGTYASFGAGTPARVGLSLFKAARKTGRIGKRFSGAMLHAVGDVVDGPALKQAFSGASLLRPAVAIRAAREAVKIEKAEGLVDLVRDIGQVQTKAGTRAALDGLRLAEDPKDVARLARLAEAEGGKTRAIMKVLGRGAIMLGTALFDLAWWLFWAIVNLFWLCAAIKRAAERITLRVIRRGKARRLARRTRELAMRERDLGMREQALASAIAAG
jgi:hypothetical protein